MNIKEANFEDLLETYYHGTSACEAARYLTDLIRRDQNPELATLLRDYRSRAIYLQSEIEMRAATDRLLNCYSVMEIASLTDLIPDIRQTEFGTESSSILESEHVRRYYSEFYPTKLPQLFRCRLAGANRAIESINYADGGIMAFLDLDRQFMENLEDGYLLRMLDSFSIKGYRFGDVIELINRPAEFIGRLLLAPAKRDVLSQAVSEFSILMHFCFGLQRVLTLAEPHRLLQSAIWNHYSYWFDIMGKKLSEQLSEALAQFLSWEPVGDDIDAAKEVQAYVFEARAVLEILTSRRFAEPVDAALNDCMVA